MRNSSVFLKGLKKTDVVKKKQNTIVLFVGTDNGRNLTFFLKDLLSGKECACQCRRLGFVPWVRKNPLEEEMATHSNILA